MALCLGVSMDALVFSRSWRALLAFAQSSITSTGGVTLQAPEATAIGEMLVGIPSREASATSALTWDEVSTRWSSSSDFWGGGIGMITGLGLLRVKFSDLQPDISNTAQDRRFLTSTVMLPSPSNFEGVHLCGLATTMVETSPRGSSFWSGSSTWSCRISISR